MSIIYLSKNANKILQSYLLDLGHHLKLIEDTGLVYPEVATHPDIYMCKLGSKPESPIFHIENKEKLGLGYKYPENTKYNAVCMGKYFIHNIKYTSPLLFDKVCSLGFETIAIKQGYTKCNMVVINDHAAITSDEGIYKSAKKYFNNINNNSIQRAKYQDRKPIDILLIEPGHVKLGNFPYGFLGGASGRVGNEIIFNGNLKAHPDYQIISNFISSQGLAIKYFEEYPLEDIGSIIEG